MARVSRARKINIPRGKPSGLPQFVFSEGGGQMNQAERAGRELRAMDDLAAQDSFLHRLSPLSKLFVTIFYLAVSR